MQRTDFLTTMKQSVPGAGAPPFVSLTVAVVVSRGEIAELKKAKNIE